MAQADVEGEVLRVDGAAVPRTPDRDDRTDERRPLARSVLEVEEEGRAAVPAAASVAEEDRRTPLRALQRPGLPAEAVAELHEARRERDGARVVESLEGFDCVQHRDAPPQSEADGEVAKSAAARLAERVEVCANVREQVAVGDRRRSYARLDVERREAARHAAVCEAGESVDRVELVSLAGDECAAEPWVEEIFLAERDGEEFIRLPRHR